MQCISIDFGGTNIKLAVVRDGKVTKRLSVPAYSENGLMPRLSIVKEKIMRLAEGRELNEYEGIGVALPGIVNSDKMQLTEIYNKYEDMLHYDLSSWFIRELGLPIKMQMDSKAALLGEMNYGCAGGFQDVLMIIMGTGIGTAVAIGGSILNSHSFQAGALGAHISIERNGRTCTCGSKGCLEAYTGGWAVKKMITEHPDFKKSGLSSEDYLDYAVLKKWVIEKDRVACEILSEVTSALRTGIISLIHAYDPQLVVLSGGVTKFGESLTAPVIQNLNDEIWNSGRPVQVRVAERPNDSVLLGLYTAWED